MERPEQGSEEVPEVRQVFAADECPVPVGEKLVIRLSGPQTDGIRLYDSRGWTAASDIRAGMVETASASGIRSEGEDLTLEAAEILVRRLNGTGGTWGQPLLLNARVGGGVDCEARDSRGHRHPTLRVQVTRPKMPAGFWERISLDSKAEVPRGAAEDAARSLWDAVEDKRPAAQRDVILALNAIRTPWLALPPIVEVFRQRYGDAASHEGWRAIWVVGADETFTERLDRGAGAR